MGPLSGHLGAKVSALLDGQLPADEAERAWAHVHTCHACRDLVEREGWVKTRLVGLSMGDCGGAPDSLKGALRCGPAEAAGMPPGDVFLAMAAEREQHRGRRTAGLVAIGGGAVGAAVMGVIALGAAPADAPPADRRAPVTQIGTTTPGPTSTPTPGPAFLRRP
ncbi:zf-HC2 domain-containing protein [Nocardioides abyssi]|uniref:Zf-HC2 domain-containing protein n=1 Tax=Nocardioides abyssi TaxID=3058370 RepID=A0ABT8EQ60_9ACTN|nr:zf-HC2 domain-containing protein [Nocardioides abyssi]MDN4160254.1 zf-HC2 domain-containing protein [Nocardioides abyssi]